MILKYLPLFVFAAFLIVDALANWRVINGVTVSEWVWSFGWPGRLLAGALCFVLFDHLVFQWYGP